eukprot:CAMPEP_0202862982 /NCGR_PEP_ID=MMETSP1391-20130828/3812_1 /ASSEMBLY_ACC=CAM_ASM_000867 /TAXON_ID=1034604 /ORGANISM="Chlamydomonas leiostraca, Strain SAG 11-49" /LENGTH=182 /DNA_ID=CAMNT_0049542577 /DNA_START=360 /DNA_END=904 /DNA_ORIENTATION=-
MISGSATLVHNARYTVLALAAACCCWPPASLLAAAPAPAARAGLKLRTAPRQKGQASGLVVMVATRALAHAPHMWCLQGATRTMSGPASSRHTPHGSPATPWQEEDGEVGLRGLLLLLLPASSTSASGTLAPDAAWVLPVPVPAPAPAYGTGEGGPPARCCASAAAPPLPPGMCSTPTPRGR